MSKKENKAEESEEIATIPPSVLNHEFQKYAELADQ